MTAGLTQAQAKDLLDLGWKQDEIYNAHVALREREFFAVTAKAWGMLVRPMAGSWTDFIYYRDRGTDDLDRWIKWTRSVDEVVVAGDGSGTKMDSPAGIGVVVLVPGHDPQLISEAIGPGTNNRAELMAVWRGLKAVPVPAQRIVVRTDSMYTIGVLSQGNTANANAELVGQIREDLAWRAGKVRFEHVPGHAGVWINEMCDALARVARTYGRAP